MTSYRAKFFDGIKPESHIVDVTIKNCVLEITKDGEILEHWPLRLLHRDKTHLSTVILACQGDDDARLELLDQGLLQDLQQNNILSNEITLNGKGRWIFFWLAGILAIIALVVLGVKPLTKFIAQHISLETEQKVLSSLTGFTKQNLCSLNLEQSFALEKLLSRIYPQTDDDKKLGVQIHIKANAQENALALPGAEIWIYSGLIHNAKTPEEIAGVLAHEIEHIKQHHIIETLVRGTLLTSFLNIAVGDISSVLIVDPQTAINILSRSYDREMESSADEGARQRLRTAGISTQGLIDFFHRNQNKSINIPKFLSTHPLNEERIQNLKKDMPLTEAKPLLTNEEWNTLKTVCK